MMMENWANLCRGCLATETQSSLLNTEICEKFLETTTIEVKEDDGLPHGVCRDCLNVMNVSYQFKKQCMRVEKELRIHMEEVLAQPELPPEPQVPGEHDIESEQIIHNTELVLPPNIVIKAEGSDDEVYLLVINDREAESTDDIEEFDKKDAIDLPGFKKELEFEKSVDSFLVRQTKPKEEKVEVVPDQTNEYNFMEDPETNDSEDNHQFILPEGFNFGNSLGILNSDGNVITIKSKSDNLLENGDEIITYIVDKDLVGDPEGLTQDEEIECEDEESEYQILNCDSSEFVIQYADSAQAVMMETDGKFLCSCGKTFTDFMDYDNHQALHLIEEGHFECSLCGKVFETNEILTGHMILHTNPNVNIDCPYCEISVKRNSLTQHIKYSHNEVKPKCTVCQKTFANPNNLRRHLTIHTGVKPYQCDLCSKSFHQKITLESHKTTHLMKPFICQYCENSLSSLKDLIEHQRSHCSFGGDDTDFLTYGCQVCDAVEPTKSDLKLHIENYHVTKSLGLLCSECGEVLPTHRAMTQHMAVHKPESFLRQKSKEKRFDCETCGKICTSQALLVMHERVHTNERPYQCPLCAQRFKTKTHLRTHQLTHTREKRFGCSVCMKFFALKGNLVVHLRTHTGERPYVCRICNEAFIDSKYLKKHKERKHFINNKKPWNEY